MLELEDGDKVKVFQYVALMSKGRIESDKDQVFKYLVENLKSSCDVITDLEIRKLKRLYKKGYSALEIAYNINRPVSFVKKYIKKIENKK